MDVEKEIGVEKVKDDGAKYEENTVKTDQIKGKSGAKDEEKSEGLVKKNDTPPKSDIKNPPSSKNQDPDPISN